MLFFAHVDKVVDDNAPQVAQPKLPGDFLSNPLAARRAGDPADFFAAGGSQFHPRSERNLAQRNQAA